jgi:geranylgeranyl diphosphate synthase type II
VADDLLDATASSEELGKTAGKDAKEQKATYPALYGVEGNEEGWLMTLVRGDQFGGQLGERDTTKLAQIARFIVREKELGPDVS